MNKKLIAAAVSAVVVAPVASHAEMTVYGRVNNAIDLNDIDGSPGAESTSDVSSIASRFGLKGSTDIGNGLTVHGRYEFSTTTDKEEEGVNDIRIATAGVSGSFGRIDIGNQWSSYFNTFGTLVSPTYSLGYYLYSSVGGGPFRASNTIKYSNTFGPLYAELDVRLNESKEGSDVAEKIRGDGFGLGLSFSVTDNITIAAAFDSEDGVDRDAVAKVDAVDAVDEHSGVPAAPAVAEVAAQPASSAPDTDRLGVAIKGNLGGYWASLGWQNYEVDADVRGAAKVDIDTILLYVGGNFSEKTNWLIGYSQADDAKPAVGAVAATDDSEQITWGVYHNFGGGLRIYYEATDLDSENNNWDGARHLLGMRVDF